MANHDGYIGKVAFHTENASAELKGQEMAKIARARCKFSDGMNIIMCEKVSRLFGYLRHSKLMSSNPEAPLPA